jgi:predicted O-methyltransferase YrrM
VPRNTMPAFEANLERYAVTEKVEIIPGTFEQARNSYDLSNFDLIFIDAAHDLASVRSDIAHALPLLAPGGLLAFHDYRSPADPDVAVAVDALIDSGGELLSLTGSLAVVRPPASVPSPSLLEV